jgi:phage terminase large subunit-like protein
METYSSFYNGQSLAKTVENMGKTWAILADNLKYIHDPNYFSAFFRRTTTELETNLWPEAVKMYLPFLQYQSGQNKGKWIGKARIKDKDKTIIFPSGAKSKFSYMEYDKHADAWFGAELSRAYFDEFHRTSFHQFNIIRSRLRSKAKFPSAMRVTLNPDPDHFVFEFVERYLDEEGYPKPELSGKTAYYVMVAGDIFTAWTQEELLEKFPDKKPQSYAYVPATLMDNKVLLELEPDYKDNLDSMPEHQRKQLLLGCWFSKVSDGMYFKREWLHKADRVPQDAKCVRGWDKASEEPNPSLRHPDYTASVKMYKDRHGNFYLAGGCRFRKQSGPRDLEILRYAEGDGRDCYLVMPQDPGGAGADSFRQTTKLFLEEGFVVKKDPFPATKSKVSKFEPFSTAAANGQVYIVESEWNPDDLKSYLTELESFDGSRSGATRKDDGQFCSHSKPSRL